MDDESVRDGSSRSSDLDIGCAAAFADRPHSFTVMTCTSLLTGKLRGLITIRKNTRGCLMTVLHDKFRVGYLASIRERNETVSLALVLHHVDGELLLRLCTVQ